MNKMLKKVSVILVVAALVCSAASCFFVSASEAVDNSLTATKRLNVALHKTVTAPDADPAFPASNLTDDNRTSFIVPADPYGANDDWFAVDLEKRYVVDAIEIYDRYNQDDAGGRRALSVEGSNDPDFNTYDILGTLEDGDQDILFPDNGCFTANGNGNAYRYIRVRRTGGYYYGYSEIKVWANQVVTEVTRNKTVVADDQYAPDLGMPSNAVNGTNLHGADCWIAEEPAKYHFLTVDMAEAQHIGLVEMEGRILETSTEGQRNFWTVYGSNSQLADQSVLTGNAVLDEAATGYNKLFATGSVGEYVPGEYIFPEYPGMLQQVISDENAYRYLTFKRNFAGSTYIGELRGFVLNPMVNSVAFENGVVTVAFSDVMNASTVTEAAVALYDGVSGAKINASASLSADGYTLSLTPAATALFYKVCVDDAASNHYGVSLGKAYEAYTMPENLYSDMDGRTGIYANVALNKPITSSGLEVYDAYPVTFANDGTVGQNSQLGDGTGKFVLGTAIGVGKGYVQIDLQNRYPLEKVQIVTRPDNDNECYTYQLRVLGSNDPDFAAYDVLDEITDVNPQKLVPMGAWDIYLDGTRDYRYLRVERPVNVGEWGFAEIRAYAKFDGISLTKNATADSYYHYGKGEAFEASFLAGNVLDGNENTFHVVFPDNVTKPLNEKLTYLQVDLKNAYPVAYAELTSRVGGYSGDNFYQHFDFFGSNIGDIVTDDEVDTHPYLNVRYLEDVDGYTKLSRTFGNVSLGNFEDIWEFGEGKTYQVTFDDTTPYRYITHKTNNEQVGVEISEMRLYATAQRVNFVRNTKNTVTVGFMGDLLSATATKDFFTLYNKDGKKVLVSDISYDGAEVILTADEEIAGGKLVVSKDIMNEKGVPMASSYEAALSGADSAVSGAALLENGADATALKANTAYTFRADYTNLDNSEKAIYTYIVLRDKTTGQVKAIGMSGALSESGVTSASLMTGDVENCVLDAYIWNEDLTPVAAFRYFE